MSDLVHSENCARCRMPDALGLPHTYVERRDEWTDLYDHALPADADGAWIRKAIDRERRETPQDGSA